MARLNPAPGRCWKSDFRHYLALSVASPDHEGLKALSAVDKAQLQKKLKDIRYLIIDEKSMLGLWQLSWIDDRLREPLPGRNGEFFGGLNILGWETSFSFRLCCRSLSITARRRREWKSGAGTHIGASTRRGSSRLSSVSVAKTRRHLAQPWRNCDCTNYPKSLGGSFLAVYKRSSTIARFTHALRVYATKDNVNEYNHYHLNRLGRPVIQITAKNVGLGAAAPPDDKAGNLAKQVPVCIGARLMLTCNLWQQVGLCNGAHGTVYDIGWAPGADPVRGQPCVIMMEFDKYTGPTFLSTADGRKIGPILPVERDFLIGATLRTRI